MTKKSKEQLSQVSLARGLPESSLSKWACKIARISRYLGWPVLIGFLFGPPASVQSSVGLNMFFIFAIPIALCSVALRWWSFGFVREKHFVVNGPFRYVRNPVELSCLLAYVAGGVLLALPGWYVLLLVIMAAVYMSFIAIGYESLLLQRHASKYKKYMQRVRRWIPLSLPATNSENQDFSIGRAFFYDKQGWLWFIAYIAVYSIRRRWYF